MTATRKQPENSQLSENAKKLLEILYKNPARDKEVSEQIGISTQGVWDLADELVRSGYLVKVDNNILRLVGYSSSRRRTTVFNINPKHRTLKILVMSDTRIGSRFYQGPLHATAIARGEAEGVDIAFHLGNVLAGRSTPSYKDDNFCHTFDEQVDEAVQYWPHSKAFNQYLLAGKLDLSLAIGEDVGRDALATLVQRTAASSSDSESDLVVAGSLKQDFVFRNVRVRFMHPMTDMPVYAKSYRPQNILRSIATSVKQAGRAKREKPDIVIMGGFGVGAALRKRYGIRTFLVPSLQSKTSRQGEHSIAPEIGFAIFTLTFKPDGSLEEVYPEFFNLNPYHIPEDAHLTGIEDLECDFSEKELSIISELMSGTFISEGQLSRRLNINRKGVKSLLARIASCGLSTHTAAGSTNIVLDRPHRTAYKPLPLSIFEGSTLKIALISDTHLFSKWKRMGALQEAYRIMDQEEVEGPYHAGDWGDGAGFTGYRGHVNDVDPQGITDQENVFVETYPRRKKKNPLTDKPYQTEGCHGNHDEWAHTAAGYHLIRAVEKRRPDIRFIGGPEETSGVVVNNGFSIRLYHPAGGGSYADSYKLQRGLEDELNVVFSSIDEMGENVDPESQIDVFAVGHYHFFTAMFIMGVGAMMLPSFKGKDRFHKEHWLTPDIGFVIAELTKDRDGNLIRFAPRYIDLSYIKLSDEF